MKTDEQPSAAIPEPSSWEWSNVFDHLTKELFSRQLMRGTDMPVVRVRFQLDKDQTVAAIGTRWAELDEAARQSAWVDLIQAGYDATKQALPVCVRCGECCRRSSPTLYTDDVALVLDKEIPPEQLVTLRRGEPVRSPFSKEPFHLQEECIKVRERSGHRACVFFAADEGACGIYENRPLQCRAQACWDTSIAEELAQEPKITRRDLFAGLEEIMTLLEEHDRRCSFTELREAFEAFGDERGEGVSTSLDAVVDAVAFEDHFRNFVAEQLALPANALDLFFGRSFVELVKLFGFKVEKDAEGANVLSPIEANP